MYKIVSIIIGSGGVILDDWKRHSCGHVINTNHYHRRGYDDGRSERAAGLLLYGDIASGGVGG